MKMELPDCPPGAEGYEDTVTEIPKKPDVDDSTSTKAELEFQEHLNSLKVKLEDGSYRCMVEKRGRDVSSNWIYLCYPCAAVCSGESILQTHISGKKHKTKLTLKKAWPESIFETHPYIMREKGFIKTGATEKINQKMAEEVNYHNNPSEMDLKYDKYREVVCHIQETLDNVKAPLLGLEYLIEHPPEKEHYEPSYLCTLCSKQGHPRTIVNHLTCFWHRCNYLGRHFHKADMKLIPHRRKIKYREGVQTVVNRLAQRIDDKYGRLKPVNIDKEEFEKDKERILQWIFRSFHFSEDLGHTFEEVVDDELINSLSVSDSETKVDKRNPSPPVVPAPTKPQPGVTRASSRQRPRHDSADSLSDISDEDVQRSIDYHRDGSLPSYRDRGEASGQPYDLYSDKYIKSFRSRYAIRNIPDKVEKTQKPGNYDYKMKLLQEKKQAAIEAARKTLAYHEKNPEKHPLYPEEWKKFWNKRYKEIQAEGKDPSKHDFKPEWISFWMGRMKELHDEELRVNVSELYRKMGISPSDLENYEDKQSSDGRRSPSGKRRLPNLRNSRSPIRRRSPDPRRRSPDSRRRSPEPRRRSPDSRRRSPDPRRRSPDSRRRSPDPRRRSPDPRRKSPDSRRRSPDFRRRSPESRRRSPEPRRRSPDYRARSPILRRHSPDLLRHQSPPNRKSPFPRRRSPEYRKILLDYRQERRSPLLRRRSLERSRSPLRKSPSSGGDGGRRGDSPLSQRAVHRNVSPRAHTAHAVHTAPSMQTVLISDDELHPDDGLSPWNSDNDIESVGSTKELRSRGGSVTSRNSRSRPPPRVPPTPQDPQDFGPTDNVVATLRLLVALEDYLGSLGPKIVDLLTDALRMEKEKANSSEELLDREVVVALLETAKEKLKGAVQAGLVTGSAAVAVRAAVVRVAAALHEADKRNRKKSMNETKAGAAPAPVSVAGVGAVDRAEIAAQMAAALVAEGRTDVSPEELAQLVEAVVGMAEAKKREVQAKKQAQELNSKSALIKTSISRSSATTALQMLQSAYDDRNAPVQREDTSDAMDGLSDSDLETLLKNFNELSAEEQHSLIAYLKKLEMREPQRVERLRRFVSAAAVNAPPPAALLAPTSATAPITVTGATAATAAQIELAADTRPVTIESDDDDYTVEEVFQSATQKVKENQIKQEMEIVKKSLEETKTETAAVTLDGVGVAHQTLQSSAADLLALVQASIQSTSQHAPSMLASVSQPRSFGDLPDPPASGADFAQPANTNVHTHPHNLALLEPSGYPNRHSPNNQQGNATHSPQKRMPYGGNCNNTNDIYHNANQNMRAASNIRAPMVPDSRQNPMMNNRQPYIGDSSQHLMADNRQPLISDNRQPLLMQDNRQPLMTDNRQPLISDNRQPLLMQDNRQPLVSDNRQPLLMQPHAGDQQAVPHDNRQSLPERRQPLIADNRPCLMGDGQSQMTDNIPNIMGDRLPATKDRQPLMMDNRQSIRQPLLGGDHGQSFMPDNREQLQSGYDNYNQDNAYNNRSGWNNYRNGSLQNSYSQRPEINQQNFNNFNKNPNMNIRGRGRGYAGGRGRGRGRI